MKQVKLYTLKENIVSCFNTKDYVLYNNSCENTVRFVDDSSVLNIPNTISTRIPIQKLVKHTENSCEEIYIAIDPEIEKLFGLSDLKRKVFEKQQIVNDLNNQILISKKSLVATEEKLKQTEKNYSTVELLFLQFQLMTFWQRLVFLVTTRLPNFK